MNEKDPLPSTRAIKKKFVQKENFQVLPETVELYSPSDNSEKFIEIQNDLNVSKNFVNKKIQTFYNSKITFNKNKGAYKELYDGFLKHQDKLYSRFNEIISVNKELSKIFNEESAIKKKEKKLRKIKGFGFT